MSVTQYAESDGVHLAYQVLGDGPRDLLLVNTWVQHVELMWEIPELDRFLRRLAGLGRLIVFDRRGAGLSDTVSLAELPDLETQVADAIAVLDAAGSQSAVAIGLNEGGPIATLLAARQPTRCDALVLIASVARESRAPDYPFGAAEADLLALVSTAAQSWLTGLSNMNSLLVPSRAGDDKTLERLMRYQRSAVRPGAVAHYFRQSVQSDVRSVLSEITVPTLAIGVTNDFFAPAAAVAHMAERIAGAKFVELPGSGHIVYFALADAVFDEVDEFVTGSRASSDPDRVVVSLLFTDVVGSTSRAAELGDRKWRQLLDAHDQAVRRELHRYGGREVDTAGDGFFAAFASPAKAIECAHAIVHSVRELGLEVRAGVHTGECEVRGEKYGGLGVHVGARIGAMSKGGEVLVSGTVKEVLTGAKVRFDDRGEHALKGVPGTWRVYAAVE